MFAPELLPVLIGVAVLSSAFPYTLEMYALTRMPTRTFGTLMSLEPAIAAMSGLIFLGEQLTPIQWIAIGAIILASAGTTLSSQPNHPAPVPTAD
ncbi:Threonine/homoserine exporter RhtA [compost metagenome]